jgi:diguanylate cyclase (GGDEF)-like protein
VGGLLFGLVALCAAVLTVLGRYELRRRRRELEAFVALTEALGHTADPSVVARHLLDAVTATVGISRGVVLAGPEGQLSLLADVGLDPEAVRRPDGPAVSPVVRGAQAQGGPVTVGPLDPADEPWLTWLLPDAPELVVVPLQTDGRFLGGLVLERRAEGRRPRGTDPALARMASYAALTLRNVWLFEQLRRLAATDGLTKIANRRTFETTLEREVARAARSAEHLSLVLLDIDHFKRLNDAHGHQAGDEVLRNVAAALSCACRDFDTAARYGGEEFAVVLPGCAPAEALVIADRLRRAVAAAPAVVPVTASAGVATYPDQARDASALVRAADEALYASKRGGRDRTTGATGVAEEGLDALLRSQLLERLGRNRTEGEEPGPALAPAGG